MTTLLRRVVLGASVASLLLISALPSAAADDARIRVLHASPDAPAVDIYVNDSIVEALTNVPFGAMSDYLSVPAGDPINLDAGRAYSVFAIGSAAAEPLGGNELTVLAALDGQWMPDTSTESGVPTGTDLLFVGLLMAAGLATFAMFLARGRFAPQAR